MSFNVLRKMFVEFPERVREIALTDGELKAVKFLRNFNRFDPLTTKKLSNALEITTQHASAYLSSLHRKGYTERRQVVSESGGYEYENWLKPELSPTGDR